MIQDYMMIDDQHDRADDDNEPLCLGVEHIWIETYYGYECQECGLFIPFGCEPWMPLDDDEDSLPFGELDGDDWLDWL